MTAPEAIVENLAATIGARGDARPIVLLDGGSGAGKSTLATALAVRLEAELVRLDDIYPGWDGLEAGSEAVYREIVPLSRWRRWDWEAGRPAESRSIDPSRPLIVEGCGALSRRGRSLATFGIWLELDAPERRRRAIARDGQTYLPYWDRWARQEAEFFARERPDLLADMRIDAHVIPANPAV